MRVTSEDGGNGVSRKSRKARISGWQDLKTEPTSRRKGSSKPHRRAKEVHVTREKVYDSRYMEPCTGGPAKNICGLLFFQATSMASVRASRCTRRARRNALSLLLPGVPSESVPLLQVLVVAAVAVVVEYDPCTGMASGSFAGEVLPACVCLRRFGALPPGPPPPLRLLMLVFNSRVKQFLYYSGRLWTGYGILMLEICR